MKTIEVRAFLDQGGKVDVQGFLADPDVPEAAKRRVQRAGLVRTDPEGLKRHDVARRLMEAQTIIESIRLVKRKRT